MLHDRKPPRFAHASGHTSVCFSEDGRCVITCGNEGDVRIWKGLDDDDPTEKCVGEKAMALTQRGDKLYVACDRNIIVLSYPSAEIESILTRFTALATCIDASADGTHVVAGASDMEINLVEVATSKVKYFSGHKAPIISVAIDPRMEYIASSSCDGTVRVWLISNQTVVKEWNNVTDVSNSFENRISLCKLSWESKNGRLLAVPYNSEIRMYQRSSWNQLSAIKGDGSIPKKYSITCWSSCGRFLAASSSKGEISVWNTLINKLLWNSLPKDQVEVCALAWNPDVEKCQLGYCDAEGQLSLIDNCYATAAVNKSIGNEIQGPSSVALEEENDMDADDLDYDDDDPDAISLEKIKSDSGLNFDQKSDDVTNNEDEDRSSVTSARSLRPIIPPLNLQPSFQPYSMPVHLQRRFMVFNDVGYVKQTNTDDENMLDVDFHDISIHHSFRINNLLSHTIAALSSEALVLACEKDEQTTSKVVCTQFHTLDGNKEWSVELPEEESAQLVAVGKCFVAVATDFHFLRLFTLSGNQREVVFIHGPIVTMNASNNLLVIVYHSSAGLYGDQNMNFIVYRIDIKISVAIGPDPLPLTPKATIKWIGFSDFNNLCTFDSNDILQIYNDRIWKPVYYNSLIEGRNNHLFVTGVNEENMNIRCVFCKGTYYPLLIPHPFITEINWKVPLCEQQFDKGVLEETYLQSRIASHCILGPKGHKVYMKAFPTCLKLFALACRSGFNTRALELVENIDDLKIAELCHLYCTKAGNIMLADKISEYMSKKKLDQRMPVSTKQIEDSHAGHTNVQTTIEHKQNPIQSVGDTVEEYNQNGDSQESCISNIASCELNKKKLSERLGKRKFNPFKISQASEPNSSINKSVTSKTDGESTVNNSPSSSKTTFVNWFRTEKPKLLAEFPTLTSSELTNVAAKRYASLNKQEETPSIQNENNAIEEITEDESAHTESAKRKSYENKEIDEPAEKKKQSKLKMFAFQK